MRPYFGLFASRGRVRPYAGIAHNIGPGATVGVSVRGTPWVKIRPNARPQSAPTQETPPAGAFGPVIGTLNRISNFCFHAAAAILYLMAFFFFMGVLGLIGYIALAIVGVIK